MNKNSIIEDIIGNVLLTEGFIYLDKKEDGVEFVRKIKNSKQEMITQLVSFYEDEVKNKMYMDIRSSSAGHTFYRMPRFVPECTDDVFYYSNAEEYVQAIRNFAHVLQKYGIEHLKKISEPIISDYFTDEDEERLYEEHALLANDYIKKEGLELKQFDVEQAAEWIEQKMLGMKEISFLKAKEIILELCAFFGAVAMQYHSCVWDLKENTIYKSCLLYFPDAKPYFKNIAVLTFLWRGWIGTSPIKKSLMESYRDVIFPYTYEEMRGFLEKKMEKENKEKTE